MSDEEGLVMPSVTASDAATTEEALITAARRRLHASLIVSRVLAMDAKGDLSFADNTNQTSKAVATGACGGAGPAQPRRGDFPSRRDRFVDRGDLQPIRFRPSLAAVSCDLRRRLFLADPG